MSSTNNDVRHGRKRVRACRYEIARLLAVASLLLGALIAFIPMELSFAGEIYKSVDSKGRVTYSDKQTPFAKRISVPRPSRNAEAERQRIATQMEALARAEAERANREIGEQQEEAAREKAEQLKKELCRRARDRYLLFAESRRPYRRDEQGNRVYYSSAEIDAERAAAQKEMMAQCQITNK